MKVAELQFKVPQLQEKFSITPILKENDNFVNGSVRKFSLGMWINPSSGKASDKVQENKAIHKH